MTDEDKDEIVEDFRKCFDVVQRMDSLYPDMPGAFTGSVSVRLERHLQRMLIEK